MNRHLPYPDMLSAETLREALSTSRFIEKVIYLPSTTSTNRVAREAADQGAGEGTLIIAGHQTAGRGRLGRTWWSPPGKDLLFSLILRPSLSATRTFRLLVVCSLAVADAIRQETGLEASIKWPNDILIKGRKIAGILSEMGLAGERLKHVIVGMGINVNSDPSGHPEIGDTATSLRRELGKKHPRLPLLTVILELIARYYQRLGEGDFRSLKQSWDARSAITGRHVRAASMGCITEGLAESIDDDGLLTLLDTAGGRRQIVSADVSLLVL